MRKRRKRPRKKNKRTRKIALIIGIFVIMAIIFISGILIILGRNVPSATAGKLEDYKKAAEQTGCTWQELVAYDVVRYENNLDDVDPYLSAVDFMKMYYEIHQHVEADNGGYWTLVSEGNLTNPESICSWLGIPSGSPINTVLETAKKYKRPEFFIQFYTKELDDLMMEKGFSEEQIEWADMLMTSGKLDAIFADVYELPDYIKSAEGGYFQWPTPELHEITSKFAAARKHPVFGITRAHNGVDISGLNAMGSPVVAIDDGVVISVNLNGGERGINIRIQHNVGDDVWISRYQHLSVASAAVGQKVTKGTLIGTVGNSGICTGPHLHLELTYNGVLIDPLPLIK
nr:M23 family metallopeptidase [uncultured Aminipila sp.]